VDLDEEKTEVVNSSHEVNNGSLSKMGFTKIGRRWVIKDGYQVGSSSGVQVESEDEEKAVAAGENAGVDAHDDETVGAFDARPSAGNMGERITSMSPFERLMVSRMDSFANEQRSLHELCATWFHTMDARFQNLDEQIEAVQIRFLSYNMARMIEVF